MALKIKSISGIEDIVVSFADSANNVPATGIVGLETSGNIEQVVQGDKLILIGKGNSQEYVGAGIINVNGNTISADMDNYYTVDEINYFLDEKYDTSAFKSVSGTFLTAHQNLDDYATKNWVEEQNYITGVDLSNYYTKTETSGKEELSDEFDSVYNNIAKEYDPNKAFYPVGSLVMHDNQLYQAKYNTQSGEFNPIYWNATNVANKIVTRLTIYPDAGSNAYPPDEDMINAIQSRSLIVLSEEVPGSMVDHGRPQNIFVLYNGYISNDGRLNAKFVSNKLPNDYHQVSSYYPTSDDLQYVYGPETYEYSIDLKSNTPGVWTKSSVNMYLTDSEDKSIVSLFGYSISASQTGDYVEHSELTCKIGTNNTATKSGTFVQGTNNNILSNCQDTLVQGEGNIAGYRCFAQGENNKAGEGGQYAEHDALAQGYSNTAGNYSLAQGNHCSAINIAFAQGDSCSADNYSFAQGNHNIAIVGASFAQGSYVTANNFGVSFGNKTSSYNYSFVEGSNASATNWSLGLGQNISAFTGSFAQGQTISAITYSLAQGSNVKASNYSIAQGQYCTAYMYSFAQGGWNCSAYNQSFAQGKDCSAKDQSLAQGENCTSLSYSFAQGKNCSAQNYSLAQGKANLAQNYSFAQGESVIATGQHSHAEGYQTTAEGNESHAEGANTIAKAGGSHAEGTFTSALGDHAHAEGGNTIASANCSHAEGGITVAANWYAHSEGLQTSALRQAAHAEGGNTLASGNYSHAEGDKTFTKGDWGAHAEGSETSAIALWGGHAEGYQSIASADWCPHAEGNKTSALNAGTHAEGSCTIASGTNAHAEGSSTIAVGVDSHSEGSETSAVGHYSHAEGNTTITEGENAHAEGNSTIASGDNSHAEGWETIAVGARSHTEGCGTSAYDYDAHAEGSDTLASGIATHAEGSNTVAKSFYAHAEGDSTSALSKGSHAEGWLTIADDMYMHAQGRCNKTSADIAFVIGNGTVDNNDVIHRSDAFIVDWNGVASAVNLKTSAGQVMTEPTLTAGKQYSYTTTGWHEFTLPEVPTISAENGITATTGTGADAGKIIVGIDTTNYKLLTTTEYNDLVTISGIIAANSGRWVLTPAS